MPERRQAGARAERAEYEMGPSVMCELGDRLVRQFGSAAVQFERLVGDAELAKGDRRPTEAVGLQRVAAGHEIEAGDFTGQNPGGLVLGLGGGFLGPKKPLFI